MNPKVYVKVAKRLECRDPSGCGDIEYSLEDVNDEDLKTVFERRSSLNTIKEKEDFLRVLNENGDYLSENIDGVLAEFYSKCRI